jgi:hypothetical protein
MINAVGVWERRVSVLGYVRLLKARKRDWRSMAVRWSWMRREELQVSLWAGQSVVWHGMLQYRRWQRAHLEVEGAVQVVQVVQDMLEM